MAKELLKRSEVKEENTWKLSDMYETNEAWEADLKMIDELASELEQMEGTVTASAKNLLKVCNIMAKMDQKIELAYNYAERLSDQDTKDTTHQAMVQKIMMLYAGISSRLAFIDPEILETKEEVLEG